MAKEQNDYKITSESFQFSQMDRKIHDTKLDSKPVGYFQDAMRRFVKNKGSVVAGIIIIILVIFAIVGPFISPYELTDKYARYSQAPPFIPAIAKTGFFDGCYVKKNQNDTAYLKKQAIAVETGYDPVWKIVNETTDQNGNVLRDLRLNMYYNVGAWVVTLSTDEYNKLCEYQNKNGVQIILPWVDNTDIVPGDVNASKDLYNNKAANGYNYWYAADTLGKPILDENGNFIPIYKVKPDSSNYDPLTQYDEWLSAWTQETQYADYDSLRLENDPYFTDAKNGWAYGKHDIYYLYEYEKDADGNYLLDADGNKIQAYEKAFEKNADGTYKLDENGEKIPVYIFTYTQLFEKDENGEYILDAEGNKIPVYEIEYEKDRKGNYLLDENGEKIPVYQVKYERDENGNIKLDKLGQPVVEYQKDENGKYIMNGLKKVPVYEVDENGNKIPVYVLDEKGNKVLAFEVDENGEKIPTYLLDENGNKIQDYEYKKNSKGEYSLDKNGNKIKNVIYQLDAEGNKILDMEKTTYQVRVNYYNYYTYTVGHEPMYIFGTDYYGRCLLEATARGARFSLILAICVSIINLTLGAIYGAIEGYYGGAIDMTLERISDILSGIPLMVVVTLFNLHLASKVGVVPAFILAFIATGWIGMASLVRKQFYRFKGQEYILAARTLGASDWRLMFKHIFPNSLGTIITSCVLVIPGVIGSETMLTYLGIVDLQGTSSVSIGGLMSLAHDWTATPHVLLFPVMFIALLMITFNLFGNGLRDAFNPSLRGSEG